MSPVQTLSLKNYFWRSEKRKVRKINRTACGDCAEPSTDGDVFAVKINQSSHLAYPRQLA